MQYYVIHNWGDVNPILYGPFPTEEKQLWEAEQVRKDDTDDCPGAIILLDINMLTSVPTISAY